MIVGLDVSTSCTGIAILSDAGVPITVCAVNTAHLEQLADKADAVLTAVHDAIGSNGVTVAFVEESLQAFRPGLSSANTICSLAKMNGLVSYLVQRAFNVQVRFISSQTARKLCGIKLERGSPAKPQVTAWALSNVLASWDIPRKRRSVDPAVQVMDAVDALVIAIAGHRMIRSEAGTLPLENAAGVNDLSAPHVLAEAVRQDRSVRIWKGSVGTVSVRVVPVTSRSAQAEAGDPGLRLL